MIAETHGCRISKCKSSVLCKKYRNCGQCKHPAVGCYTTGPAAHSSCAHAAPDASASPASPNATTAGLINFARPPCYCPNCIIAMCSSSKRPRLDFDELMSDGGHKLKAFYPIEMKDFNAYIHRMHEEGASHEAQLANIVPPENQISDIATTSASDATKNDAKNRVAKANEDRKFRNKAMLSEWFTDRPMNFESDWILKPTPVGKRCLVFSRKGETVAYSRTGQFVKAFQSALPGGCHVHISHSRRQFAIVDCFYVQHSSTFYLMDVLAWNQHKLFESEASFRFFWLQSRYNESQDKFTTISSKNGCRFYCLNAYSANDRDILKALHEDPIMKEHNLRLDGLLFFHSRGPYVPGANPLALWIKPEMVDRVLNQSG